MNTQEMYSLISEHKWVPLAALIIGLIVRLLKSDTKIPVDIPPRFRVWLALALGAASSALENVATGTPWKKAAFDGALAAVLAILGHNVLVDSMMGGKEVNIPGLVKPGVPPGPNKPPSIPPASPPGAPPSDAPTDPPPAGLSRELLFFGKRLVTVLGVMAISMMLGCGVFWKALDLAADKAKCVVANQDLPDMQIFLKCAIEDPEKYIDLLAESRAATKKALEKQAAAAASTRVDAGAPDGAK